MAMLSVAEERVEEQEPHHLVQTALPEAEWLEVPQVEPHPPPEELVAMEVRQLALPAERLVEE
jgi:hypothetical protein